MVPADPKSGRVGYRKSTRFGQSAVAATLCRRTPYSVPLLVRSDLKLVVPFLIFV